MRKRRTRQHIIEDLGFNHIEKHILLAGYVMYRFKSNEYSYDGIINTFDEQMEPENAGIWFQLKSTDFPKYSNDDDTISFDLSKKDLESWLLNIMMVVLIVYDAQADKAYFVDLQAYFKENSLSLKNINKFVRVKIPRKEILDTVTIIQLRNHKNGRYYGNLH